MNAFELSTQTRAVALLTDLYQLTMASAYWKSGTADKEAIFYLAFRNPPFRGGFTLACGLAAAIDYLRGLKFEGADLSYLETLNGPHERALFERGFLHHLTGLKFRFDGDA